MNVLLAEANVPYDEVFELEDINSEFAQADVAFVIGANDVTNPAAKTDKTLADLRHAGARRGKGQDRAVREALDGRRRLCRRRQRLFYRDNTMMLLADAKKMVEEIVKALNGSGH